MYNEEKKLITDIQRKKDLDRNLALFAGVASKANYEYACHKFTLNYLTLKDMHMDGDVPDDPYIAQCQAVIDKMIGDVVVGDKTVCEDADMKLISDVRNTITAKMKVLTSYTDAFEMYEYILNRKEYSYPENVDEEIQKELKELDEAGVSGFAEEIYRFVFADQDKVAINSKLQSIIGQLPIRMTKNRFYDILGETLDIYNGVEKESLDQFIEKAKEVDADLICMSTLMTTTMGGMQTVIEKLKDQGIRDKFKVMVGGSPISKKFADDIGAEGYSVNAVEAVKVAKELTGIA